jgi:2-C-methyl-D-erythritol 4-phosphate cytidylyltransferase
MQTPQGADLAVLLRAAEQAVSDGADVTDDVELLLRIGYPVRFILGSERNMKITTRADAERAAWFIDAIDS